jgi:DNA ligase-1
MVVNGEARSRSFKPIANTYVREYIESHFPDGLDGELMLRDPNATFNDISSAFRKYDGEPDFVFQAFDYVTDVNEPFKSRITSVSELVNRLKDNRLHLVPHVIIKDLDDLALFEAECLELGYEGVMIRDPEGPYKSGRSTEKEGYLLKIKRFEDAEAKVIGFIEQMHNENVKQVSEIGLSKRATRQEFMVPAGTLGAFQVRDLKTGIEFEIGTGDGLTQALRKEIWENRNSYIGEIVKYKFQPVGVDKRPRFPVWLGFRLKEDM